MTSEFHLSYVEVIIRLKRLKPGRNLEARKDRARVKMSDRDPLFRRSSNYGGGGMKKAPQPTISLRGETLRKITVQRETDGPLCSPPHLQFALQGFFSAHHNITYSLKLAPN